MYKIKLYENILNELNINKNLRFLKRSKNLNIWNSLLEESNYIPYLYTNSSFKYQEEYRRIYITNYTDLSSIINFNGENIGLLPLAICQIGGKWIIFSQSYFNGQEEPPPLNNPIFINVSEKIRKKVSFNILKIINQLSQILEIKELCSTDNFNGTQTLSSWHLSLMNFGFKSSILYELCIDLSQDINTIKSKFRKSYKSLIKEEKYNLKTLVMKKSELEVWSEFKKMHFVSAGRMTRSDDSWEIHLEDIINDCGLLIYVRDSLGVFLGGGFFNYTRDEAIYAVAAYDRNSFHLPIGHLVQFKAIKELKKKGIKWYKIGHLPFEGDELTPSKKYSNIGKFKKGFATDIFPKYIFKKNNI